MRRAISILGLACILALGTGWTQAADGGPKPTVTIGVRTDAPPFAWRDDDGGYSGFLYSLCVEAAVRAGYRVQLVPMTVRDRNAFFEGSDKKNLDLLCDPITITLARLGALRKLDPRPEFSPIVFVANGSYVTHPEARPLTDEKARGLGCIDGPPANEGARPVRLAAGFVGETTAERTVRAAVQSKALALKPGERLCLIEKDTHWDAAEAFCAGELRYYFGDEDILRHALRITADRQGGCPQQPIALPLSYEPYALVVAGQPEGFRQDFVAALYALFHYEPAERRFGRSFAGQAMSPYLETLFRILSIPAGDLVPEPDPDAGAAAAQAAR